MLFTKKNSQLLSKAEQQQIVAAIAHAETHTTGEIRVYVESRCKTEDAMETALGMFTTLEMHKTVARNAVLIYVAIKDRKYAIYGDQNVYIEAGGPGFWDGAAQVLVSHFTEGKYGAGIAECVRIIGEAMANKYPYDPAIPHNELPDEIVFGK